MMKTNELIAFIVILYVLTHLKLEIIGNSVKISTFTYITGK